MNYKYQVGDFVTFMWPGFSEPPNYGIIIEKSSIEGSNTPTYFLNYMNPISDITGHIPEDWIEVILSSYEADKYREIIIEKFKKEKDEEVEKELNNRSKDNE